ncbi:hypothetical protein HXA34_18945 [Salipaludibacillus agaradhaerens]|uniref:hypothetical protein n=1 Tax=Salipaludibacillus agaradhaerens TaxID=76935 RepID=UPI002151DC86|nr:hypothetical protein [Salipaludibacillus agaradhaerens]MCR6108380.1 hypothetical protein [Salipaludibacillus agaradhaerens]MCR6120403.1 hypothetical protein [Salipaludibacillus agaradhaerens]UJW59412.1 hypothetical protein HXZ66_19370 [Bacillus sp. A116_S68]
MEKRKLTFKNRLIAFVIMPCWAVIIGSLTQSLINRSWLSLDEFLIYVLFCFGFYFLYSHFYKKEFSDVFLTSRAASLAEKLSVHRGYFIFHTIIWIVVATIMGLTN